MTKYLAGGNWPRHGDSYWNEVYDEARARGWTLETHSNHGTAYLSCPAEECDLGPIYSTGKSNENVAKDYLKKVRRCPHGSLDQAAAAQRVKGHLEIAERLAKAARHLLYRDGRSAEVEDLWRRAEQQVDAADEIFESGQIELAEWWRDHEAGRAGDLLADTSVEGSDHPALVVAAADREADSAEDALADVSSKNAEYKGLKTRLDSVREEIETIRVQPGLD